MNIIKIRKDTVGCESIVHFNNAGSALMPRPVVEAITKYLTDEELGGGYEVAEKRWTELSKFYDHAAQLLKCNSRNIAYTTNATDSYNRALSAVHFKDGDVVLVTENDYPSNFIAFISLQKRFGINIVRVKNTSAGEIDLDDLERKIKQHAPRLVSVTHVPTSSGLVQPINHIGKIVAKYDSLFLVDACQSLGQIPVDAIRCGADFISGTLRKFLRGPRGAGILYVSDKALAAGLEPLFIDLRGAQWIAENEYRPRPDAKRFEDWETSYALMMGSQRALEYLLSIGIENVEQRNEELNSRLREGLSQLGKRLLDKGKNQCSIITFSVDGRTETEVRNFFKEKRINIYTISKSSAIMDFLEKGVEWVVRVSPHYYNTENEIDQFVEAAKQL
ncbi:MAG TPA: aminotransferase class V-fold PLP-dependent enzyme [Parafilimonas sp.]|nr:aminotransferase class V-fold PLP-dependent enzyme [Parafilimonas sp.]